MRPLQPRWDRRRRAMTMKPHTVATINSGHCHQIRVQISRWRGADQARSQALLGDHPADVHALRGWRVDRRGQGE